MRGTLLVAMGLCIAAPAGAQDDAPPEPPPDTLVAAAASGPGADVKAACAAVPLADGDDADDPRSCKQSRMKPKLKPSGPYQEVALVERKNQLFVDHYFAIKTGDQWYLAPLAGWGFGYGGKGSVKIKKAQVKDVIPGGSPEILLTGTHSYETENDMYDRYGSTYDALWVCSVGASGAPSCVEVPLGESTRPNPDNGIKPWKFKLGYKFEKDGRITRTLKGKWPKRPEYFGDDPLDKNDFVNTRTLAFP